MRTLTALLLASALAGAAVPALADDDDRRRDHRGGWQDDRRHDGQRHSDRRDRRHDGWRGDRRDDGWRGHPRHPHAVYRAPPRVVVIQPSRHTSYWGPSGQQWSRWNSGWGNPSSYASQWGFDEYCDRRGWRRGNQWYSAPSSWSGWGGWNWSFTVSGSQPRDHGYNSGYQTGYSGGHGGGCQTYRAEDWIQGRRAAITYVGCVDHYGRVIEQPGTRRVENWLW